MKKGLAVLNMIVILGVISWNYYTTINGFKGSEVGAVSDNLNNLFTPAGYAFSIWGIIFLGLIITGIQFLIIAFGRLENSLVERITPSLIAANLFNCIWVYVWLSLMPGISTIVMTAILVSLVITSLAIDTIKIKESRLLNFSIGIPIRIYLGWIIVATVANYSAYLNTTSFSNLIGETPWFFIMLIISTSLITYIIIKKGWYEVPAVGIWAFLAIAVRHLNDQSTLAYFSILCILVLIVGIIFRFLKNRKTVLMTNQKINNLS